MNFKYIYILIEDEGFPAIEDWAYIKYIKEDLYWWGTPIGNLVERAFLDSEGV